VDYAAKINKKPVLFLEAKALGDPLVDVKAITQVVGYAANAGVEWCILTNGIIYKVYHSTEKAAAPDKLLYEISLDPKDTEGKTVQQIAEQLFRFSRESMAKGVLDVIGEQVFTTAKIRKALDSLFLDPPSSFIRLLRSHLKDDSIKPIQVKKALDLLWSQTSDVTPALPSPVKPTHGGGKKALRGKPQTEEHHTNGKPQEVIELYRTIDKICRDFAPTNVTKRFLVKYIGYSHNKKNFCCVHLQKSGLRVWLKLKYLELKSPPDFIRDVSNIGHWGVGDVEMTIDTLDKLQNGKEFILKSFEATVQ
jgi:predicted transport protein